MNYPNAGSRSIPDTGGRGGGGASGGGVGTAQSGGVLLTLDGVVAAGAAMPLEHDGASELPRPPDGWGVLRFAVVLVSPTGEQLGAVPLAGVTVSLTVEDDEEVVGTATDLTYGPNGYEASIDATGRGMLRCYVAFSGQPDPQPWSRVRAWMVPS